MYSSLCLAGHCVQARSMHGVSHCAQHFIYAINSFCWYLVFVGKHWTFFGSKVKACVEEMHCVSVASILWLLIIDDDTRHDSWCPHAYLHEVRYGIGFFALSCMRHF